MPNTYKDNIAAIDVGFEGTKAFFSGMTAPIRITSAVAKPQHSMEGLGGGQKVFNMCPAGTVDDGSYKYVFGDDALVAGSQQIQSLDDEWLLKFLPGFICAAAAKAGVDLHNYKHLSTGGPIKFWRKHKAFLAEYLKKITCNGEVYEFETVEIRAQGVGALGLYESFGPPVDENGLLLDFGGNTVLAVMYQSLRPVSTNTHEYDELGFLAVAHELAPALSEMADGRVVTEIKAMKAIIDGRFRGAPIANLVKPLVSAYLERVLAKIRSDYRNILPELDMLVVVGGGAYYIGEALKKEYPRVTVMDSPEFANVRGYHHLTECALARKDEMARISEISRLAEMGGHDTPLRSLIAA